MAPGLVPSTAPNGGGSGDGRETDRGRGLRDRWEHVANSGHLCSKLGVKEASKGMGEVAQWAVLEPTQTLIPTTPRGADVGVEEHTE